MALTRLSYVEKFIIISGIAYKRGNQSIKYIFFWITTLLS